MTASSASRRRRKIDYESRTRSESGEPYNPWREPLPMKPRRGLFMVFLGGLLVWSGVMLWMYFRTIHRASPPPPRATAPALARTQ